MPFKMTNYSSFYYFLRDRAAWTGVRRTGSGARERTTPTPTKVSARNMVEHGRTWGGQGRAGQGRAGQGRAGQGRAGQGRAGQGRAGQGRAGQGRAGQPPYINFVMLLIKVGSGGGAVEGRTINQWDGVSIRNLGNFVHLILSESFERDTKSRWSLLSGVYARGSKRSHTGGKYITCSGFIDSREGQLCKSMTIMVSYLTSGH